MPVQSPYTVLYDANGNLLAVSQSQALGTGQPGYVVVGSGSAGAQFLKVNADGALLVSSGAISLDNFPTTQSILLPPGPTSTVTLFTGSIVSTELLATNPNRKMAVAFISSSSELNPVSYLKFGTGPVSNTDYSVMLFKYDYFEFPRGITTAIHGIFNIHTGSVEIAITEIT